MDYTLFGEKLKELRGTATQQTLGELLDVGDKQISRYEKGEVLPSHENIQKLCDHFQYDFISLIYKVPDKQSKGVTMEKYIATLERDAEFSRGELRHIAIMNHAILKTLRKSVAQLIAKQEKVDLLSVARKLDKETAEYYRKTKEMGNLLEMDI